MATIYIAGLVCPSLVLLLALRKTVNNQLSLKNDEWVSTARQTLVHALWPLNELRGMCFAVGLYTGGQV